MYIIYNFFYVYSLSPSGSILSSTASMYLSITTSKNIISYHLYEYYQSSYMCIFSITVCIYIIDYCLRKFAIDKWDA